MPLKTKTIIFEIEDGFEIPRKTRRKFPWADMKIGQSFFVPTTSSLSERFKLDALAMAAGKSFDMEFHSALVKDGVRIWRTK